MSSQEQVRKNDYVLTPLSDLVVGEEEGHELAVGAARVDETTESDGEARVVVAFDALRSVGLRELAREQNHVAADAITGPQTARFRPAEVRLTDPEAPVPVEELEPLPERR